MDADAIQFEAAVNQVRTLADGGIRVVFDLPEDAIPAMAMLAECKRQGIYLLVSCEGIKPIKPEQKRKF
jgi:hypothetical protein